MFPLGRGAAHRLSLLIIHLWLLPAQARLATRSSNRTCCGILEALVPGALHFKADAAHPAPSKPYWSKQEQEVEPRCFFLPANTQDVSKALHGLSQSPQCEFAIRSGGHMAQAGAANIQGGVTIDLGNLDQIVVSPTGNRSQVILGSGARWGDVYAKLAPYGLAVPGARSGQVGVGGYLLGGGSSYFVEYGFGCDSVVAYQVVLGNGTVLNVTSSSHSDLFRALRGGSSNFGIVTAFTVRTFPFSAAWGGKFVYPAEATVNQQLTAFHDFIGNDNFDVKAAVQMTMSHTPNFGTIFVNQPFYALPHIDPPALQPFTRIQPQLVYTTRIDTLRSFAAEDAASSPNGFRQMTWAFSIENDLQTLQWIYQAFSHSVKKISRVPGIVWSVTLEPLPQVFLKASSARGGNVLGLGTVYSGSGLILCDARFTWTNDNDTALVRGAGLSLLKEITQYAKQHGTYNDWVHLNHADLTQDPISSYGSVNKEFLEGVSRTYDPAQIFQRQVPGGFKLTA